MVENKYKHAPTIMLSRNGDEAGEIRNLQSYRCPMEGCTGWRICVKWPDGRHTYPCSCGCKKLTKIRCKSFERKTHKEVAFRK